MTERGQVEKRDQMKERDRMKARQKKKMRNTIIGKKISEIARGLSKEMHRRRNVPET